MTTSASSVKSSSVSADSWEQLVEDGRKMGQVHWLLQSENGTLAGLWKIDTEEGAEVPYNVTTSSDSSSQGASTRSRAGSPPPGGPGRRS